MNTSLTRKKFLINSGIAVAGMLCGRDVLRAQPGTTALVPSPAPSLQSADNVPDFPEHDPQIDRARGERRASCGGGAGIFAPASQLIQGSQVMNEQRNISLNEIGQISVNVHDFDRAVAFYKDTLGIKHLFTVAGRMAFFDCGSVRLMLTIPERPDLDHPSSILYFKVPDIEQAHEGLVSRKVHFETKPMLVASMATHDLWLAEFRDSENNVLALMCEKPR